MRKIIVLSVGRSDYDRYQPILSQLKNHPRLVVKLIAGSNHQLKNQANQIYSYLNSLLVLYANL